MSRPVPTRSQMSGVRISISNLQSHIAVDDEQLRRAVQRVFQHGRERPVQVGIAIVDDSTIHELNRRHLGHDYPTDVLSYPLEDRPDDLQGEIVVSAETAVRNASSYGLSPDQELCLYVVHGALHLAGYRDKTGAERRAMRQAERDVLAELGISMPDSALPVGSRAEEDP